MSATTLSRIPAWEWLQSTRRCSGLITSSRTSRNRRPMAYPKSPPPHGPHFDALHPPLETCACHRDCLPGVVVALPGGAHLQVVGGPRRGSLLAPLNARVVRVVGLEPQEGRPELGDVNFEQGAPAWFALVLAGSYVDDRHVRG